MLSGRQMVRGGCGLRLLAPAGTLSDCACNVLRAGCVVHVCSERLLGMLDQTASGTCVACIGLLVHVGVEWGQWVHSLSKLAAMHGH